MWLFNWNERLELDGLPLPVRFVITAIVISAAVIWLIRTLGNLAK